MMQPVCSGDAQGGTSGISRATAASVRGAPISHAATRRSRRAVGAISSRSRRNASTEPWLCDASRNGRAASRRARKWWNASRTSAYATSSARCPSSRGMGEGGAVGLPVARRVDRAARVECARLDARGDPIRVGVQPGIVDGGVPERPDVAGRMHVEDVRAGLALVGRGKAGSLRIRRVVSLGQRTPARGLGVVGRCRQPARIERTPQASSSRAPPVRSRARGSRRRQPGGNASGDATRAR